MKAGAEKLVPFGVVLGQDDDARFVDLINSRWVEGSFPGPVFGRLGSNHQHREIENYQRLEILWAAAASRGDYFDGDYDSEAYAHPPLRDWERPGADYYQNVWKDLATTQETLTKLRSELAKSDSRRPPPSREKPFWPKAEKVAAKWLDDYGFPESGDGNQAELEQHIADWLIARGHKAGETTIRRHVVKWIGKYRNKVEAA
jgi:hypothetical protein